MQFKGFYFDITHPHSAEATITLLTDRMKIDVAGSAEPYEWFYGMVKKKKEKKNILVLTQANPLKPELTITDPQFLFAVKQIAPFAPFVNPTPWYQSKNGLYSVFAVKIGTIVLAILLFFFAVPYIVDFIVDRISPQTEATIGNKIKSTFIDPTKVDSAETRLVNNFFQQLSSPGKQAIHITVVNSKIKNAYTLPGGEIVVYSDIFSVMNDYPELVALLGHESGHAEYRHSLKMLCRESSTSIILLSLVGNMNGATNVILNNASYLENLSYSREYESQADRFSYDWMVKNRVDPQGMLDLFSHLEKESSASINVEFISTHPLLQSRMDDVKAWMKKDGEKNFPADSTLEKDWQQIKASLPAKEKV